VVGIGGVAHAKEKSHAENEQRAGHVCKPRVVETGSGWIVEQPDRRDQNECESKRGLDENNPGTWQRPDLR
jgi:hypothetical protein